MCMLWLGSTDVAGLMAGQLEDVDAMAGRLFPRLIPTHSSPLPFLQKKINQKSFFRVWRLGLTTQMVHIIPSRYSRSLH